MPTSPLSIVQTIEHPIFEQAGVTVSIKRDDLIHPIISGNKWRKLAGNITSAKSMNKRGIISFGGAYSNHIHALSYACHQEGLDSIGIIRGEPHYLQNYTLSWASHWGMQVQFVERQTYKKRHDNSYLAELSIRNPNYLIVPEGGTNNLALIGVGEVIKELDHQTTFDTLILPVGSGGTIAGLAKADDNRHDILGICVLKGAEYLNEEVKQLINQPDCKRWSINHDFHQGGYAKFSEQTCRDIFDFSRATKIPFEPVYSGKMIVALFALIKNGYFPKGHKIMLLHTGGMQGVGGLLERNKIKQAWFKEAQWHLPSAPLVQ